MPNLKEIWELNEDGPDPEMKACIRCKGMGYYNSKRFTKNASRNKGECPLCKGRCEYPENYYAKCPKCRGNGFWFKKGVIGPWTTSGKPCTGCEGCGYIKLENPESELRPIGCLMCKAKGHSYYKGWIHQGNVEFIKDDCPCCEGNGWLLGNFSRCKRCKGKGAFGKNGVLSQYHNPKFKIKDCEDCEGKGFIKEEEPVEEESESVSSNEDSSMKKQPNDDGDYGGNQPGGDGDYYGDNNESGASSDSESEEEKDNTPEPEMISCIRCKGKGYYGKNGWVANSKISKGNCPLCDGKKEYAKNHYRECLKCETKGYFNPSGKSNIWIRNAKPCSNCQGIGFNKIDFNNDLGEPIKCVQCKGKGHCAPTIFISQESKQKHKDCPCCKGKGQLYGEWEKCITCKGKGGYKGKSLVPAYSKNRERDCEDCEGRGFNQIIKEEPKEEPKKKQPSDDGNYGGDQPSDNESEENSTKKKRKNSESKSKSKSKSKENSKDDDKENEPEEKEEEKEPEPEPEPEGPIRKCIKCTGLGHYNQYRWCGPVGKLGDCQLCEGKCEYDIREWRKCEKCTQKGFFSYHGWANPWNKSATKTTCSGCNSIGYHKIREGTQLKAQTCLMCSGKGHYSPGFGFIHQGKRKGFCPCCLGKGELYGDYEKCNKCSGKGYFDQFGACFVYKNSDQKQACEVCNGKGYSRPEEQDKIEEEEKEKFGWDLSVQVELTEVRMELPEDEEIKCCIIL